MLNSQVREHFRSKAKWKGYEFTNGKKHRVQYLDNVAIIGNDIINNQDRKIERECNVVLADEFTKRRSNQRNLSIEEAVKAVAFGIETKSNRNNQERYQYLYNDILAAGRWVNDGLFEIITAYRVTKAHRRNFINDFGFLEKELTNAGTFKVNAAITDLLQLAGKEVQGVDTEGSIVWQSGDPPFLTNGMTVYCLHLVLACKGEISRGELEVLKNWGLGEADAVEVKEYKDGTKYQFAYNMSRFSGNEHEWSYC